MRVWEYPAAARTGARATVRQLPDYCLSAPTGSSRPEPATVYQKAFAQWRSGSPTGAEPDHPARARDQCEPAGSLCSFHAPVGNLPADLDGFIRVLESSFEIIPFELTVPVPRHSPIGKKAIVVIALYLCQYLLEQVKSLVKLSLFVANTAMNDRCSRVPSRFRVASQSARASRIKR